MSVVSDVAGIRVDNIMVTSLKRSTQPFIWTDILSFHFEGCALGILFNSLGIVVGF